MSRRSTENEPLPKIDPSEVHQQTPTGGERVCLRRIRRLRRLPSLGSLEQKAKEIPTTKMREMIFVLQTLHQWGELRRTQLGLPDDALLRALIGSRTKRPREIEELRLAWYAGRHTCNIRIYEARAPEGKKREWGCAKVALFPHSCRVFVEPIDPHQGSFTKTQKRKTVDALLELLNGPVSVFLRTRNEEGKWEIIGAEGTEDSLLIWAPWKRNNLFGEEAEASPYPIRFL